MALSLGRGWRRTPPPSSGSPSETPAGFPSKARGKSWRFPPGNPNTPERLAWELPAAAPIIPFPTLPNLCAPAPCGSPAMGGGSLREARSCASSFHAPRCALGSFAKQQTRPQRPLTKRHSLSSHGGQNSGARRVRRRNGRGGGEPSGREIALPSAEAVGNGQVEGRQGEQPEGERGKARAMDK